MSRAGRKAWREVQQPAGAGKPRPRPGWAGHCSRNSLGVSIFSVQRTGQLYGSKNKAISVCHPRGRGRGWQGELRTQREAQECGKAGLPRSPPPCFQGVRKESVFLWEDRICLGIGRGHLLHSATAGCCLPLPAHGCAWGRGSRVRPTSTPSFVHKHLLRAYCVPRFSSPQGGATKTLSKCKITTGWPTGRWVGLEQLLARPVEAGG